MSDVEHVLSVQDELGEGPLWHVEEQALFWVDIDRNCYHRYHPGTNSHERVDVGARITALAFRQQGGLLATTTRGFATWDTATKQLTPFTTFEIDNPNSQFNDAAVDRRGRFLAGALGDKFNNNLFRLDPNGTVQKIGTGYDISNGIGWSPDNKIMYFVDSTPGLIYAFDYDIDSGAIENRRVLVDTSGRRDVPDGLTVDSEGFIWCARWEGACIERYDPAGALERTIKVPATFPTSLAFGGENLDVLYITSARVEIPADKRAQYPVDGDLFRVHTGIRGLPEPKFGG